MLYFDKAIEKIVAMHEAKASDYTKSSEFENFEHSAKAAGVSVLQAIDILVSTKEARIISLRGRLHRNESIIDTYLDRAVYSIIAYAHILQEVENGRSVSANKGMEDALSISPNTEPKIQNEVRLRNPHNRS